jgi:hypothetical protein
MRKALCPSTELLPGPSDGLDALSPPPFDAVARLSFEGGLSLHFNGAPAPIAFPGPSGTALGHAIPESAKGLRVGLPWLVVSLLPSVGFAQARWPERPTEENAENATRSLGR